MGKIKYKTVRSFLIAGTGIALVATGLAGFKYLPSFDAEHFFNIYSPEHFQSSNEPVYASIEDYFIHSGDEIMYVDNSTDEPIMVELKDFNEKERELATKAIKQVDDAIDSINYVVLEENQSASGRKITINNNVELSDKGEDVLGVTYLTKDYRTHRIAFPITIELEPNILSGKGEICFVNIVQHELGHSLGLQDVYERSARHKTIMYGHADDLHYTFTNLDRGTLKNFYDIYSLSDKNTYFSNLQDATEQPPTDKKALPCKRKDLPKDDELDNIAQIE